MQGFFGEMSPFEIIIAVVALLTAIYNLWLYFRGPKVEINPASNMGLVANSNGKATALNLPCNIVNTGGKVGTLQHVEVNVKFPDGQCYLLPWEQFYRYREGGGSQEKESDTYPVAVNPHDSRLLFVQFKFNPNDNVEAWIPGHYTFEFKGWVNSKDRQQKPTAKGQIFHIEIDSAVSNIRTDNALYSVINIPVQEWQQ